MKTVWIVLCAFVLGFLLSGCDKTPKDLPSTFKPGVCIVCKKKTKVQQIIINPLVNYNMSLCWRPECEQAFGANRDQYIDKSKLPNPADLGFSNTAPPSMPGQAPAAPAPK